MQHVHAVHCLNDYQSITKIKDAVRKDLTCWGRGLSIVINVSIVFRTASLTNIAGVLFVSVPGTGLVSGIVCTEVWGWRSC